MGIIAHQQIRKMRLSEGYLEVKQRYDRLVVENQELIDLLEYKDDKIVKLENENKKLKAAVKKLEKEIEKLKNPPIWMNDGEL